MSGLTGGPFGTSLAAVLLWSGRGAQEVMVEWSRLDSDEAVAAFAAEVENMPRAVPATATAIGEAMVVCETLLRQAPARRRVIDIAGDGRSNEGIPPPPIRNRLVAAGVTINGLCVLHEEPDLLESYRTEVIGGPGAFALQCQDFSGFASAMRQKLEREVAGVRTNPRGRRA
jgi:hypothetical protein